MLYFTIIGGAFVAWLILAMLFTPGIPYHVEAPQRYRGDAVGLAAASAVGKADRYGRLDSRTSAIALDPALHDPQRRISRGNDNCRCTRRSSH
jgi:hypothetical protein